MAALVTTSSSCFVYSMLNWVRFEVLTVGSVKFTISCYETLCSLLERYQYNGRTCCLHLQEEKETPVPCMVSYSRKQQSSGWIEFYFYSVHPVVCYVTYLSTQQEKWYYNWNQYHRFNFIVYCYIFWSSWDHHQELYIINTVKLVENPIWIHIVVECFYIIKVVNVVENCALCYDENYNIEKYWKY
jgi:hypothetical protein